MTSAVGLSAGEAAFAKAAVHLGRAFLMADKPDSALDHFHAALDHHLPGGIDHHIPLLIDEAARCVAAGDHREAIQRWQDIAALLAEKTPEWIYHRLGEAYAANKEGFGGSPEENTLWGDCSKHDLLAWFNSVLQPKLYLEIGVDEGVSLACASGPAIGVDPRPQLRLSVDPGVKARIVTSSSDAFFTSQAEKLLQPSPELAFIDGMHLFEFALRDFINTERHMAPWGLVVIDDIYPCHPVQARRRRTTGAWTGDVWKLLPVLRSHRHDLTLLCLNAHTTGLLLIAGLDAHNIQLNNVYEEVVREYRPIAEPPDKVLDRHGAIPSNHPLVLELLQLLRHARRKCWDGVQIQSALAPLNKRIAAEADSLRGQARQLSERACQLPYPTIS
ncbi:class I SAM-dependent methyltransferase [Synechococcus sp. ATX 2A4]|uniref:class I SAM-dependent methyltransferase n=1 Tax=Synechococcus sp. ATX 2A4 TaxID=2823727 RepID=UPI0020CF724C|nr:class I SAM-dependent methyltransferase [Synechococcus sp. ATX 2A4]MCP9886297.1 class I SAM-dependent methyltransferase [Synechococcus sp. ATX 2A4]